MGWGTCGCMTRLVRAADSVAEGLIQRILCQTAVVVSSPLEFWGGVMFSRRVQGCTRVPVFAHETGL